ncbi:DUF7260 family protein [Natronobeatus ordinarius]|uniref:DUF7260 family protein n=1 Tax=Natronobeatus ordinarius TaxID=2963433 RepID=UPI0020CE52FA|nr:hypothetical protein [Natronobeatus ordinarius]
MTRYYSQRSPKLEPEVACSGIECTLAGAVDLLLLLLWIGLLGIVIAGLLYLPRARETCDEERARTHEEAEAFDRFARRVSRVDATPMQAVQTQRAATGAVTAVAHPPDDRHLREIRDAYRDTVMSVGHYEDEYGDPLAASVTEEFDRDVAAALTDGRQLTPQVKRVVLDCAFEARDRREEFLESLTQETNALTDAQDTLADVDAALDELNDRPLLDRSYDELEDAWYRLRELRTSVEALLEERQATLHGTEASNGRFTDSWTMYAYLYSPLSTSHPVLAEGARLLEEVTTAEHRVADSLSRRV